VSAVRSTAGRAVKELSWGVDRLRPPASGVTVLIYHRVGGGTASAVDLPAEVFARQLEQLRAGYRVVSLGAALDDLAAGGPVEPSVVVTFDDGTADFVDVAVPLLARYEVPATLYVATAFVDGARAWPDGSPPVTRAGLAEAVASGWVELGSHTHRHLLLDRLDPADVGPELDRSVELLGEWCGVEARDFAYPKAVAPSPAADASVRRRFRSAALARPGANRPGDDVHALRRTPVQRSDTDRFFRAKARGGLGLEAAAREQLNRLRYRGKVA
jgi:peptidoglycan/xylan/chitin deacetylase (PgdA/CDA1 family)